jgi:hypothetical protein
VGEDHSLERSATESIILGNVFLLLKIGVIIESTLHSPTVFVENC